jgi:hypothetical protein
LDQKCFIVLERFQRRDDGVERSPVARSLPRTSVDDEIVGPFGDVGIEIVHEHAERGFLRPAFAADRRTARRPDDARAHRHDSSFVHVERDYRLCERSEGKNRARACQRISKK